MSLKHDHFKESKGSLKTLALTYSFSRWNLSHFTQLPKKKLFLHFFQDKLPIKVAFDHFPAFKFFIIRLVLESISFLGHKRENIHLFLSWGCDGLGFISWAGKLGSSLDWGSTGTVESFPPSERNGKLSLDYFWEDLNSRAVGLETSCFVWLIEFVQVKV